MSTKKQEWRTVMLVVSLLLSIVAVLVACQTMWHGLPTETPAAFGVEKFYRNAYFKGDVETAGDLTVGGYITHTGSTTDLGNSITDEVRVWGQLRTWDGADNWTDIPNVSALGHANGWQASYRITGWGDATTFKGLFANTEVTRTFLTTQTFTAAEIEATVHDAITPTEYGKAVGVLAKVSSETTSTIPIAYPFYSRLSTASDSFMITGTNFMADLDSSGTITNTRILHTEVDTWGRGLDLSNATFTVADIVLSNGETITNTDNGNIGLDGDVFASGKVNVGGFLALAVAPTLDLCALCPITPTASYQPLSVAGSSVITTGNPSIVDGSSTGDILILVNVDDQDIRIEDGQNVKAGGAITLTANAYDSATFIWDGADWVCLSYHAN